MLIIRAVLALTGALLGALLVGAILVLGLPFLAVSFLTRAILLFWQPSVIRWPQMFEFDPTLGWKAKANLDCHCLAERDDVFHVLTDDDGWSGKASLADSEVVVVGDSHAFGYGVDHKSSFSQVNPRLPIKAIGVPGYNLVQEVLLMNQLACKLKGKLVVWFVYVGNDLHEDLAPAMSGYRTPFVRRVNGGHQWEIVTSHLRPTKWSCSSGRLVENYPRVMQALHSETFLSERAYSACEFLIEKGRAICRHAGGQLVVMSIPAPVAVNYVRRDGGRPSGQDANAIDAGLPDRRIGAICSRYGIPFVPLRQYLDTRDYKERDDHWTERGHRRVAEVLWRLYRDYVNGRVSADRDGERRLCVVPSVWDGCDR